MLRALKTVTVLVILCLGAFAAHGEAKLSPELEDRARALFLELRCVVCQNQSIGDSDADVAKDLREIVREQISAGQSNSQIKQFLVDRYGEFILLKPVLAWHTLILWIAPLVLLLIGGVLIWRNARPPQEDDEKAKLTDEEKAQIEKLLNENNS